MKRIDFEMLEQIHQKIAQFRIREGYKSKDDFSVKAIVSPASINKWSNKSEKEIFKAAKNGEKSALEYIFYKMEPAIQGAFWGPFLGPNGEARRNRIHDGAWEEWLGTAWMTLTGGFRETHSRENNKLKGALDSFDPEKVEEGKLFLAFGARYKMMLKNSAQDSNFAARTQGISGAPEEMMAAGKGVMQYEPTWIEGKEDWSSDDETSATGESYVDETFDKVNNNLEAEKFLDSWKLFCQDQELYTGMTKGVTPAQVFYEVITDPQADFRKMQNKLGASHNSLRGIMEKALQLMEKHHISNNTFTSGLAHWGNEKLASYLSQTETVSGNESDPVPPAPTKSNEEAEVKPPSRKKKEPVVTSSFEEKFEKAFEDEKMWIPHKKGLDAANMLYLYIDENFPTMKKLSRHYPTKNAESDTAWWLRRAFGVLKKNGITEQDIKNEVKEKGKEAILDLIGEDNTDDYFNEE